MYLQESYNVQECMTMLWFNIPKESYHEQLCMKLYWLHVPKNVSCTMMYESVWVYYQKSYHVQIMNNKSVMILLLKEKWHVPLCIKVWWFDVVMYNAVWKCDDFIVPKEICYVQLCIELWWFNVPKETYHV